jgi:hypothetical protein
LGSTRRSRTASCSFRAVVESARPRVGGAEAGGTRSRGRCTKRLGGTASRRRTATDRCTGMGRARRSGASLGRAEDRGTCGARSAFVVGTRGPTCRAVRRTAAVERAGPGSTSCAITLVRAPIGGSAGGVWTQRHRRHACSRR